MTGKERATRQSVPAKAQRKEAARVDLAKHGERIVGSETANDAGIQRPTASTSSTPRDMEVGRGESEIQRSRQART